MSPDRRPAGESDTPPPTPFLVVPYGPTDVGVRPLPPTVTSWICPSIHLNGAAHDGSPLPPGVPIQLSVLVDNRGALAATVIARWYWADPCTAFTPATVTLVAPGQSFWVPANTAIESPAQPFTPGGSQPAHLCLLVEVTAVLDPANGSFDPIGDRHYAQQNLQVLHAAPGQQLVVPFVVVGTARARAYEIRLRQDRTEHGREALMLASDSLWLIDVDHGGGTHDRLLVELQSGQRRTFHAVVTIPHDAPPGSHVDLVIEQHAGIDRGALTGAIGATIRVGL